MLLTYVIMDFCLKVDGVPIFEQFMEPSLALFIGIILSVIVNVVYCIWNDAYYGMQESTKKITIMFTVVFALNVLSTIVYRENLVKDGKMTFHMANPICAGLVALVVLVTFLKKKRDEHEMEDENG